MILALCRTIVAREEGLRTGLSACARTISPVISAINCSTLCFELYSSQFAPEMRIPTFSGCFPGALATIGFTTGATVGATAGAAVSLTAGSTSIGADVDLVSSTPAAIVSATSALRDMQP